MKFSSLILFGTLLSASTINENKIVKKKQESSTQQIIVEEQESYSFL